MSNTDSVKKELSAVEAGIAVLEAQCKDFEEQNELSDADYAMYEKLSDEIKKLKARQNRILTLVATDNHGRRPK